MEISEKNFLFILTKIRQCLFAFLEAELAKHKIRDISPSYGDILFVLDRKGPLTVLEIAQYAVKDKSTVSSIIKRLGESGYVVKEKDGEDGRLVKIKLTARAKKIKPLIREISAAMNERLYRGFSEEEKEKLFELVGRVYKNV